jgi:hypothetical protein
MNRPKKIETRVLDARTKARKALELASEAEALLVRMAALKSGAANVHTTADQLEELAGAAREKSSLARSLSDEATLAMEDVETLRRQETQLLHASRALGFIELLVPKRIADEELGDAAEALLRLIEQRRPRWQVYLKVVTTIFWVLLNAFRASGRRVVRRTAKRKG